MCKRITIGLVWGLFITVIIFRITSCSSEKGDGLPDLISYNFHIRPILSDKCYACHGPDDNVREAGLSLHHEQGTLSPLESDSSRYPIVPGDPSSSEIYRRISSGDLSVVMPPPESHLALSEKEIALIRRWIEQGGKFERHWAFNPPNMPVLPPVKNEKWPRNEIDFFVLKKMEDAGLSFNAAAERSIILRRLSLDLTGLPPTIEMQERFLEDTSPEAYQKMVDYFLASPHYGEKMALHWLDLARYADSHGYQDDGLRTMWPWRDWVIHAFNQNYPYDKFVTWQLAGDLIPERSKETLLATGFNRNHKITQEGGVIDEEYRIEYVTDRTNTFGKTFLGLTLECAKCHDHKFDPISQREYFSAFAFFDKVPEKGLVGDIQVASLADPPNMSITDDDIDGLLHFVNKRDTGQVKVMVMEDSVGIRTTHILNRGNYDAKTDIVEAGTPSSILAFDSLNLEKNRLGLSEWLFARGNPLTARIFVNRIWQEFFGTGIVKSAGDFGLQGDLPSHPQLLDWLAVDFMDNDWDIKRLVKLIVSSNTYQQSSAINARAMEIDPENRLLASMPRRRLRAEFVRDVVMQSSGLLNTEIGGPSVKPYQPKGLWESATSGRGVLQRYNQDQGEDLYRRGMYTFIKRTVPPPVMLTFDASNRDQCEVRRYSTTTPLQALIMLNDPTVLEASRVLAQELSVADGKPEDKIKMAFRAIVSRLPNAEEQDLLMAFYSKKFIQYADDQNLANEVLKVGEYNILGENPAPEIAALMQVIHLIYNMDETIMIS